MSHYFINDQNLAHEDYQIRFTLFEKEWTLYSDNGIFSKRELDKGTRYLLESIALRPLGKNILDIGCGAGAIGLLLAALDSSRILTLSDVNARALACAKRNAEHLGVSSRCTIVESDAFSAITAHFDTIVSNPPIRAGKKVTYKIYEDALEHLNPEGTLYLVIRKEQGAYSALRYLNTLYKGGAEIIFRKKGYCIIAASKVRSLNEQQSSNV